MDSVIHGINLYLVDSAIGFPDTYISTGWWFIRWITLFIFWTTGSEFRISNPRTDSGSAYKKKIPGFRNLYYRTPGISITDSILIRITVHLPDSTRKKFPDSGIRITVHLGYPLLTVFCSAALEIKTGNRTWYLGCLDSFLWKCYPGKRIHCTCHLVTLNIFHWVKNLRCHLCFLPVRLLDGCYFL